MNAETRAMNVEMEATPEITRAAERYLEQYGDPLVMNTYLKVTVLVLATVCFALAALAFKSQKALADMHPMIVRINDVDTPKPSTIATSSTAHRKPRTNTICRAGRNSISAGTALPSSATRPIRFTSSIAMCNAP